MTAEPIRLLIVTHSLSGGGAERFASHLLTHLPRDRFRPSVCLAADRVTYPVPDDVEIHTLGYRRLTHLPRAFLGLRRLLDEQRPDLVLSNVLSTNCLTGGALRTARHRPPWVARVGNDPRRGDPPLQRMWAKRVYPRAARVVTNSRGLEEAVHDVYPGTRGKTVSIPNPTDFEALERLAAEPVDGPEPKQLDAGEVRLLWIGRLTFQKRLDVALEALARLRGDLDARLWVCGEGPLQQTLRAWARDLGVADAVKFFGFLDNPFPLVPRSHLFWLSSDYEGLPNALIETQGLGLPAVATRCPYGPEEIIDDGVTGRLVPASDPGAVAQATRELWADRERLRSMGEAARHRARERFALDVVLPRWERLLLDVMEDSREVA